MKDRWIVLGILIVVFLAAVIFVFGASAAAQTQEPIALQPTFRLMDGDKEMGLVYGLDYGWLILTDGEPIYTCGCFIEGCDECECDPEPQPTPDPTPVPTPDPTDEPKCNRGLGNGAENCDPGNSGGKPGSAGEGNE